MKKKYSKVERGMDNVITSESWYLSVEISGILDICVYFSLFLNKTMESSSSLFFFACGFDIISVLNIKHSHTSITDR